MDKVEIYKWAKPGDTGRDMLLRLDDLKIDHSYQRNVVKDSKVLAIARDFSWIAFGKLIIMRRENGDYYIIDGQQRRAGAMRRGDIERVPCLVFRSDGRDHEAAAFLALNTLRTPVTAIEKFRAAVKAGIDPQRTINSWLNACGIKVGTSGTHNVIDFPSVLVESWIEDEEATKTAIQAQLRILTNGEGFSGEIHKGFTYLAHNGIDILSHVGKIKLQGGKVALIQRVRSVAIEIGKRGYKTCGLGVLELINFKRKNRIVINQAGAAS